MDKRTVRSALLSVFGFALALNSGAALAQTTYRLTKLTLGGYGSWSVPSSSINASGQVTGWSSTANDAAEHAFLWDGTSMVDLGTLGGSYSIGVAINASGQVAGNGDTIEGDTHPFLWDGTSMVDLGTLGGTYAEAYAINDSGQVTGYANTTNNAGQHAFLWDGTSMVDLGTLGGRYSYGRAINASGQVTGTSRTGFATADLHAFLWDGTSMVDLGTLGGTVSFGVAINASGQVTGVSDTTNDAGQHAFLWDGTSLVDLGTLGGTHSNGVAINASGQVTGYARTTNNAASPDHAFLWNGTSMVDLGTLGGTSSRGYAINDSGQVTGYAYTTNNAGQRAFLWDGTSMQDLNALIDANDPLKSYVTLIAGQAINSSGAIVADGVDNRTDETHAYIVSPVQTGGSDSDDDGINDSVDANPGTASNAFNDGEGTSGSITDRAGLTVTIEDAASPDGVRVVVGAGSGQVTLDACGFTETVAAGSELIITCGSVTLNLIQGAAQVVLDDGRLTVVSVPQGVTATVSDNGDGTVLVQNVGGTGVVSVTVDGTQTTVAPGGSQSYTVVYPFAGFFSPVDNPPMLNVAKAGRAIPVKFSLGGDQGLAILAAGSPSSKKLDCDTSALQDDIEQTVTAGSSSLFYDAASEQYYYVWKTDKAWFGTCRQLKVRLNDSTEHVANFKFK